MPVRRYKGKYPRVTRDLYEMGLLRQYPTQRQVLLFRDHGINITYRFKGCTPEKFRQVSKLLLEAAYEECERYPDYRWKFARIEVRLSRTAKGRKSLPLSQTYTASKHVDSYIMVYGPGYEVDEKIFLIDQIEKILDIPARYLGRVSRQRPYVVTELEICVRAGLSPLEIAPKEAKE